MSGLPLLLAGAFWVHGIWAAAAIGPILGGLAVLTFGGPAGRLAGGQWAPAGALVLGFTLPEQYVSRASFSETAAQVLLFGGLCLVADALTLGDARQDPAVPGVPSATGAGRRWLRPGAWTRWFTPQRAMMELGGPALGLAAEVAIEALPDELPPVPFLGLLLVGRGPTAPVCP